MIDQNSYVDLPYKKSDYTLFKKVHIVCHIKEVLLMGSLNLSNFLFKNVIVFCKNGNTYKGYVDVFTSGIDNEDPEEGILCEDSIGIMPAGIWLYEHEIKSIRLA